MGDRHRLLQRLWLFRRRVFSGKDASDAELLLPATELLKPQNPPPGLLCRIEEEIEVIEMQRLGSKAGRPDRSRLRSRYPWFITGLLTGAVASALLLILLPQTIFRGSPAPVAAMAGPAGAVVVKADNQGNRHYLIVEFQPMMSDQDGAMELWALAPEGEAPRSLGLLTEKGAVTVLALSDPLEAGYVLALSREPDGGSPGSGPSGPVLMTAEIR
ncbi:anti-sigma factor [Leisingera caerulea]|uniref:Anti-sigma factor n=1 Tax=Leisingera caerulea TaxID=506591 RepID=A0A9Q9HJQ9_LEICA|nr:anti-sigma factor [Leisingera caerulea]UWQ55953.1 anti-sigma factor [Leisingera caerulea]